MSVGYVPSWLPDPDGQPPKADKQQAALYRQVVSRDLPGPGLGNRHTQAASYSGVPYIAIRAVWHWLSGATIRVLCRKEPVRKVRKALTNPSSQVGDERWQPADDEHPLTRLFERINSVDTFPDLVAKWVIQCRTSGNTYVWTPLNVENRPGELWVLPSWAVQPLLPAMSKDYPYGGWRINPGLGVGWSALGIPGMGMTPLDAREVLHFREPGSRWFWDGYSPMDALGRQIDAVNAVETSRAANMANAISPSAVVTVDGISQDGADELSKRINGSYAGADKRGKVWVADGKQLAIDLLNQPLKDMDYPQGWEQSVKAVLAGFGVPPSVAGLVEAGNYAAYYAALRQFFSNELRPTAARISAFLTKHLAHPYYGHDYAIQIDLPTIDDPDLQETQINSDAATGAITVNEIRKLRNREPLPNGDVTVPAFLQSLQAPTAFGQPGGDPTADPSEDMSGHPLSALGDGILESLGVHPGSDADPTDDDTDDSDLPDTDVYTDAPANRVKAMPWSEDKHPRDGGKFSRLPGQSGQVEESSTSPRPNVNPAALRHPRVVSAVKRLTQQAASIAANVNAKMLAAGLTPAAVVGDQTSWETWFTTQYADVTAHALGIDSMTAANVLSHLVAHGVQAIKRNLSQQQPTNGRPTQVARPAAGVDTGRQDGSDGGPPRPKNRIGAGSLPSRKAFAPVPELEQLLESLG